MLCSVITKQDYKDEHILTTLYSIPFQETEAEIEDEVDILMSSDIVAAQMSTKQITFSRAQTGWIFRADKKVCTILLHVVFISSFCK